MENKIMLTLLILLVLPVVTASAVRNFNAKTDDVNHVNYVCQNTPYSIKVSSAGSGYQLDENLPSSWTVTSKPGVCNFPPAPGYDFRCSQAVSGASLTIGVSNSVGSSGTFSGQYSHQGQATTSITGSSSILVKGNSCIPDNDGDNYYGTPKENICGCSGLDCDDTNANIHPGAAEICGNNIDENCNGPGDDPCASTISRDAPDKYSVGQKFTVILNILGGRAENNLVLDEVFDSTRFSYVTGSSNYGGVFSSTHPGHIKWILKNPGPANIQPPYRLTYDLSPIHDSAGIPPPTLPPAASIFSGQYLFTGRSVSVPAGDTSIPCITDESQCNGPGPCCGDGFDNDCDGNVDCADSDCSGKSSLGGTVCCAQNSDCTGTFGATGTCGVEFCDTTLGLCDIKTGNSLCTNDEVCNAAYSCVNACQGINCGLDFTACEAAYGTGSASCTAYTCMTTCPGANSGSTAMGVYSC